MDTLRLWLARRLDGLPVPYRIGRKNVLATVKMTLVWAVTPPTREG